MGFRGWLGPRARTIIREQCHRVLSECYERMSDIRVEAMVGERADGKKFVSSPWVAGASWCFGSDQRFCCVIAQNVGDGSIRGAFLELLQLGEWALKDAAARTGRELGVKDLPSGGGWSIVT